MRKAFYGILSLFLLVSCTNPTGQEARVPNDGNKPILTDEYFVSEADAQVIANEFFSEGGLTLLGTDGTEALRSNESGNLPSYYIFTKDNEGFVIVSASEIAYPILGYSKESTIDLENLPDGLRYMLDVYSGGINEGRRQGRKPSDDIKRLREFLKLKASDPAGEVVVASLLKDIAWDQMPYYNAYTPNPQVPVGCVATATSQIMRYWKYPEKAVGHHSYNSRNFGLLSFDFNHIFDWANMPAATLTAPNEDIAILCYGVAVAINMNFDYAYNGGSGAVHRDVPPALYRHYGYPKNIMHVQRANYDADVWTQMVKNELDNGRPVQYGGTGSGGGHSFVLDGYDSTDLFHVNWGWAGQSNGWFKLTALDPDDLGTGGGSGGFNNHQDMLINFAPPARIEGDNNETIEDDEQDSDNGVLDNGVNYETVMVFNPLNFFIRYTKFDHLITTSGGSGYIAYLTKNITVETGNAIEYAIEISVNDPSAYPKLAIYIDYDDDGKFATKTASGEKIYETPSGEQADFVKGTYIIPKDAKKGLHRMRVVTSDIIARDPNKSMGSGEVEDYYITIK